MLKIRSETALQIPDYFLSGCRHQWKRETSSIRDRAVHAGIVTAPHRNKRRVNGAQEVGGALFEGLRIELASESRFDFSIEWVTNHVVYIRDRLSDL
jgi:hypothetical protein